MMFPGDQHRHAIYGMTGTGKTVFALWCLSKRSYTRMPWIIVDAKKDETIAKIPRLEEIAVSDKIPKSRGLYVVRPMPDDFAEGAMTDWLYRVWARERVGIMIDEGYTFAMRDRGLQAVLTQGRSKRIPVIALSQRPSWISPFIHSESEFKSVFFLQTPADIDRVKEWLPACDPYNLAAHHSYWYCLPTREFCKLGPCPDENAVLEDFDARVVRRFYI